MRRPSSETAPLPSFAAWSIASMIRRVRSWRRWLGVKTSFACSTWPGGSPTCPRSPARPAGAGGEPSGSLKSPNGPSIGRRPWRGRPRRSAPAGSATDRPSGARAYPPRRDRSTPNSRTPSRRSSPCGSVLTRLAMPRRPVRDSEQFAIRRSRYGRRGHSAVDL